MKEARKIEAVRQFLTTVWGLTVVIANEGEGSVQFGAYTGFDRQAARLTMTRKGNGWETDGGDQITRMINRVIGLAEVGMEFRIVPASH